MVDGYARHRQHWRRQAWHSLDNADIWKEVDGLLEARAQAGVPVVISKVKGHAKIMEAEEGGGGCSCVAAECVPWALARSILLKPLLEIFSCGFKRPLFLLQLLYADCLLGVEPVHER